MTSRIGILGGTFDPVHRGHLELARAAREALALDRVLLVPSAQPPHKPGVIAPAEDRLAMLDRALADRPELESSRLEIDRDGPSFTVHTIEELERLHPGATLFFIVGEDSLGEIPGWFEARRLFEKVTFAAARRPDTPPPPANLPFSWVEIPMPPAPISSSELRERIRRGEPTGEDLDPAVRDYIDSRKLYRSGE